MSACYIFASFCHYLPSVPVPKLVAHIHLFEIYPRTPLKNKKQLVRNYQCSTEKNKVIKKKKKKKAIKIVQLA